MARHVAGYLVVMSRSGYADEKSQKVLADLRALGSQIELVRGDVSVLEDVQRAFTVTTKPIGGIIQGAMVLRVNTSVNTSHLWQWLKSRVQDETFSSISSSEFVETCAPKIRGTWNLHNVSLTRK